MEVVERFTVHQPIEFVWDLFKDVPELSRCLPGAELLAEHDDGTYEGRVSVRLGPISAAFEGRATASFDDADRSCTISGRGVDRSGGSQGRVEVEVRLDGPSPGDTDVEIHARITLAGPIAQFGRTGLVNEVSARLIDEFAACIHAKLDAATPADSAAIEAPEVRGLSLGAMAVWRSFVAWIRRLFGSKGSGD